MTDRLFKFGSFEDEIMKSMETTLVKYQKDQMYSHDKLAKAIDHLSAAAEIFDDTGFNKEAEALTKFIEKIAAGSPMDWLRSQPVPEKRLDKDIITDTLAELPEAEEFEEPFEEAPSFRSNQLKELFKDVKGPHIPARQVDDEELTSLDIPARENELGEDPLAELKAAFRNLKKKVI
jgi:hypothetical protein